MSVNNENRSNWAIDIEESVTHYNRWFVDYAPSTFRDIKSKVFGNVAKALEGLNGKIDLDDDILIDHPTLLLILRQMTCPPLARDRLAGLARIPPQAVKGFENGTIKRDGQVEYSPRIMEVIRDLLDFDLFPWIDSGSAPTSEQKERAAAIIVDRLCITLTDAEIRNEQERRQLLAIVQFLKGKGYVEAKPRTYGDLQPGEYAIHLNIPVYQGEKRVNIPGDVLILPRTASPGSLPIIVEAKSAGDFTNVNKRRKEEATKMQQLKATYGDARFIMFLGGYFDSGYLDYEAAEGIDWVWEHRVPDMEKLGL